MMKKRILRIAADEAAMAAAGVSIGYAYGIAWGMFAAVVTLAYSLWCFTDGATL